MKETVYVEGEFILFEKRANGIRVLGINKRFIYVLLGFIFLLVTFYSVLVEFSHISTASNTVITELAGKVMQLTHDTREMKAVLQSVLNKDAIQQQQSLVQQQDDGEILLVVQGKTYKINLQKRTVTELE